MIRKDQELFDLIKFFVKFKLVLYQFLKEKNTLWVTDAFRSLVSFPRGHFTKGRDLGNQRPPKWHSWPLSREKYI